MKYLSATFILIFCCFFFANAQVKRSLNQFEKGRYDAAFDILYKALEKDSINPEVKYILSIYYLVDTFPNYSIDSSYFYVMQAVFDYSLLESDELDKLSKDNFDEDVLLLQKGTTEKVAFDSAKRLNSEDGYIEFLVSYPSSVKEDSAIFFRDQSAYLMAVNENSWNSYLNFMKKYPEADDYPEAKMRYEKLIYQDKTGDGKLKSYELFLSDYPDTPFRKECETAIFRITTGSHKLQDYLNFINSYPSSHLNTTTLNRIFHLDGQRLSDLETLISDKAYLDSLKAIADENKGLLIPFLNNGLYGFYDSTFQAEIPAMYTNIDANYFCGNVYQDVLLVEKDSSTFLINRKNQVVTSNITEFEDIGSGLLKYPNDDGLFGIIHKSGEKILPPEWEDIHLLNDGLLAVKKDGLWGIYSVSNLSLIPTEYDSIFRMNQDYILESDKYHLYKEEQILLALDQNEINPYLSIDDFLIWDKERTIVFDGDLEGLLNSSGELEVLPGNYRIEPVKEKTFLVQTDSSTYVFNPEDDELSNFKWDKAKYNSHWLALKIKDKWYAENISTENNLKDIKDSVHFITESILWTRHEGFDSLHFINGKSIPFQEDSKFNILVSKNKSEAEKSYLYFPAKKENLLINWQADTIKLMRDYKPKDVSIDYLILEYKGKSGVYSYTGKELLEPIYDAIVSNGNGTLDLLQKRKFGLYRLKDSLTISTDSDRKVRLYSDSLLIVHSDNQYFFKASSDIEVYNDGFIDFKYFNDTTSFLKNESQWNLVDHYNDSTLIQGINDITLLSQNKSNSTYKIFTDDGIGLLNDSTGLIIAPTFNEIINIGSYSNPFYIGEKYVSEADYYVLVYFNDSGEIKHRFAYPMEIYDALMCDKTE